LYTARRDRAAGRFLERAIGQHGEPEKITIDKSGANTAAIESHNAEQDVNTRCGSANTSRMSSARLFGVVVLFFPCTGDRVAKSGRRDAGPPRRLSCAFPACGTRAPSWRSRLPACNEPRVGALGLREPCLFAVPNFLAIVGMSPSLPASFGTWMSGTKFDLAQLGLEQSRTCPSVILVLLKRCQTRTTSLRAVATAATDLPRRVWIRRKKARSGPGTRAAAQAASTSMARACERPCLVIRPWWAGPFPDCRTDGFRPK
jgi:hypothetical protein